MSHRRSRWILAATAALTMLTSGLVAPGASAAPQPVPANPAVGTAGHGWCLDPASSEVQRGLRTVGPPLGRRDLHWVLRDRTRARTPNCPSLMWAQFDTSRGTGSSPSAVLLFRPGKFLRTTNRPTAFTQVTGSSPFSVTVSYRWLQRNDPTANPTGGPASVLFVGFWDSVFQIGTFPPGVR